MGNLFDLRNGSCFFIRFDVILTTIKAIKLSKLNRRYHKLGSIIFINNRYRCNNFISKLRIGVFGSFIDKRLKEKDTNRLFFFSIDKIIFDQIDQHNNVVLFHRFVIEKWANGKSIYGTKRISIPDQHFNLSYRNNSCH